MAKEDKPGMISRLSFLSSLSIITAFVKIAQLDYKLSPKVKLSMGMISE